MVCRVSRENCSIKVGHCCEQGILHKSLAHQFKIGEKIALTFYAEGGDYFAGGYGQFAALKTYNRDLKTLIAIGGWNEGSKRFSPLVEDPSRRRTFIKSAIKFLRQVCLITHSHERVLCERLWGTT